MATKHAFEPEDGQVSDQGSGAPAAGGRFVTVLDTDRQTEHVVPAYGNWSIGQLTMAVVEMIDLSDLDWSDHAMWWPARKMWLDKMRWTLDKYSIVAGAELEFTPMHKQLRIQLPDLSCITRSVDFSVKAFDSCTKLCKELGLRYPEELSFCQPLSRLHLQTNYVESAPPTAPPTKDGHAHQRSDTNTFIAKNSGQETIKRNEHLGSLDSPDCGMASSFFSPSFKGVSATPTGPPTSAAVRSPAPTRPQSLVERARMNVAWLDSSVSLLEQGVEQLSTLSLRFKYYAFHDLSPRHDAVRINLLYEQARWQVLAEEVDCTEEEMMLFAALQIQVELQENTPQVNGHKQEDKNVDRALAELQISLDSVDGADVSLADTLELFNPKRFTLKPPRRLYFVCRDLSLYAFKSPEDVRPNLWAKSLKGCEVTPELNLSHGKLHFRLAIPSAEGMTELWLRCDNEEQYARWVAACRLASRGKSMSDVSFGAEVKAIQTLVSVQRSLNQSEGATGQLAAANVQQYIAPRFLKKIKAKPHQMILDAHANVKHLNLLDAKLSFIKAWQSLPDYGVSLFVVRFYTEKSMTSEPERPELLKKDELLGVTSSKLLRMALPNGDRVKTWSFSSMKFWKVNWETKQVRIEFNDGSRVGFVCLSADCKVVHEFIGGYIFLSMRNQPDGQKVGHDMFHKLTSGWV